MSVHTQASVEDEWHERRRPDRRFTRWSTGDLARRRALVTARAELEAAELRGDPQPVTAAWIAVIAAMEAAERDRDRSASEVEPGTRPPRLDVHGSVGPATGRSDERALSCTCRHHDRVARRRACHARA